MIIDLVRHVGASHLETLVSPAFFDVVPRKTLLSAARRLVQNRRDRAGFERIAEATEERFAEHGLPIVLDISGSGEPAMEPEDPRAFGEKVVTLFFHQLCFSDGAILDLRAEAFCEGEAEELMWQPSRWWTRYQESFIVPLREVYAGYYGDEPARFEDALGELGLNGAAEVFRRQLGGDPQSTAFDLDAFVSNFADVFVFCRDNDIALPAGFVPFGISLATMYENLDRFSLTLDVKRCFETVRGDGDA